MILHIKMDGTVSSFNIPNKPQCRGAVVFTQNLNHKYETKCDNITYIMSHPNETSKHILDNGIFEKALIDWSKITFKNPNKLFIDIGSHMGTYSFNLALEFLEVHSFEAQKNT